MLHDMPTQRLTCIIQLQSCLSRPCLLTRKCGACGDDKGDRPSVQSNDDRANPAGTQGKVRIPADDPRNASGLLHHFVVIQRRDLSSTQ